MACGCGTYTPTGPCNVNAVVCKGYYVDIDPVYAVSSIGAEPLHGTVTILPNGNIRYEHDDSGLAPDSFIYNYSGGFCTISITIQEGIPDNTTVIILTASADCEVGTPTYTWTLPDCAELVEGYTIHDQTIQVIVPVYDPENPDATCEITVDVCCDFCINCCKCETYIWNPPQCVYPCGDDPICECDGPCEVYNPVTGNCDGCPDGLTCCGTFGSREEVSLLDINVECAPVYEGDELTDIEFTFTPTLSSGHISDINWYFLDIEGECTPPVEECVNYATQCESAVTLINRFNTEWDRPDYAKIQYGNTHQVFWKPSQAWINGVGHDATVIPVTLEYVTGCGNAYKSYYIVVDFENTQESCGVTILTGMIEAVEFCDEPATSCLRQDTTNCQECCSDIDCPGNQSCVEGVCECPEDTIETPLGYCCPLPELIPDCYICNDLGQVIPASDETCGVHEEFDPVTCDCVCVEGYCLDVLTNECVECPPCVVSSRFRQRTEGVYQTYIPPTCPTCKDCVACTDEPECVSGYMCMKRSCGVKALCSGNLVDQVENDAPTVPYIHPCTGLEVQCSEEHPCCCKPDPCDVTDFTPTVIVSENDLDLEIVTDPCSIVSVVLRATLDGTDINNISGNVAWYINTSNYEDDWNVISANGNKTVTIPFATYAFGFLIKCEFNGRTIIYEYFNDGCIDTAFRRVFDECIYIISADYPITGVTNSCGNTSTHEIINGEVIVKGISTDPEPPQPCLCVRFTPDDCSEVEVCVNLEPCEGPCDQPLSVLLEKFINQSGHYVYHASVLTPSSPLMYTCEPPSRTEWEDAPKNGNGVVVSYNSSHADHCGTLPNSGFTGCSSGSFTCNPDLNLPAPTRPCGWVVSSGVVVHDLDGANVELSINPAVTNTICFGVNTDCGYVCNCETITPPEAPCENFDVDLIYDCQMQGNKSVGISTTGGTPNMSYVVEYVINGITYTTTGDNWDGVGISVNLNTSSYISQIIVSVQDSLGCFGSDSIICPPENCEIDVTANAVCQENETTLITYTITGTNPGGYVVNISSPCSAGPMNKAAGTHTFSCPGWQTSPITITIHELGVLEPCIDSVTVTPTGDCGVNPPPDPCENIVVDGQIETGGPPASGRSIYIYGWTNGNSV